MPDEDEGDDDSEDYTHLSFLALSIMNRITLAFSRLRDAPQSRIFLPKDPGIHYPDLKRSK
jgi:hypothetical protein